MTQVIRQFNSFVQKKKTREDKNKRTVKSSTFITKNKKTSKQKAHLEKAISKQNNTTQKIEYIESYVVVIENQCDNFRDFSFLHKSLNVATNEQQQKRIETKKSTDITEKRGCFCHVFS